MQAFLTEMSLWGTNCWSKTLVGSPDKAEGGDSLRMVWLGHEEGKPLGSEEGAPNQHVLKKLAPLWFTIQTWEQATAY
jgi:hypothetical protein